MRLTTKGRFAVTAMIDLALRQDTGPVTLAAISQRQRISLSYLEQLFGKLRRHELVESTRGPGGGYSLGRKAGDITVADIIVSVEGTRIHDAQHLLVELRSHMVGDTVEMVLRGADGQERTVHIVLSGAED